ncbi:MAG: four helix bundle protein [Planctomycetes bacterium]|nr:four helix bundle protein [Planctomycetota bacterium]
MLSTYRELEVWQWAFTLCKDVYQLTRRFPSDERFGLVAQLRKAAVSVPSNIAEGYNRGGTRDYIRFLWIANGSVAEIETQLLLAESLGYLGDKELAVVQKRVASIERMLRAMIRSLETRLDSISTKATIRARQPGPPIPRSPDPRRTKAGAK